MQCNALKHLRSLYGLYKKYIIITPVILLHYTVDN